MKNTEKIIDPLPEEFDSEDEAGEFWDTHSLADYEEFLEPVDLDVDIKSRHYQIEVDKESYLALRNRARKLSKPMKLVASEILREKLETA